MCGENSGFLTIWTEVKDDVCNFCAISTISSHLPWIEQATGYEPVLLCQADWDVQTNQFTRQIQCLHTWN